MTIEGKLRRVLRAMGYAPDQIHLEKTSTGNVGGFVISDRFKGKSEIDRQRELWAGLREHLGEDDLLHIVAILTVTPGEVQEAA